MTTYQTKPQTVEAVQWRGDNESEVIAFFPGAQFVWGSDGVLVRIDGNAFLLGLQQYVTRSKGHVYGLVDDSVFGDLYEEKP